MAIKFNPFTGNFDIISDGATATVLGTIELTNQLGGTATAPTVVNFTLTSDASANSHKITSLTDPTNPQDAATMAWVLAQITPTDAEAPVGYASTTALPANTYANGTSGVGATLTATTNGFLIVDGVTTSLSYVGQRVLVAGEAAQANNGIYTITDAGSLLSKYILTRATDYDQASEIESGDLFAVAAPTGLSLGSNNGKVFITLAPTPFTVGTSTLNFSSVGSTYSAGTALQLSGSTFNTQTDGTSVDVNGSNQLRRMAITSDISVPTGSGVATLPTVNSNVGTFGDATHVAVPTVNAKGQVTAMTTATISVSAATQRTFAFFAG